MAMENKRITQLSTERLNLTNGDYVMVDDENNGSAKYRLDRLKETDTTLSVSGKAADAAATGQAISDEATARENADNALGEDISDLKSALVDLAGAELSVDSIEWIANKELDTDGSLIDSTTWHTSPFLEIPYTTKSIRFTRTSASPFDTTYNFFYDEEQNTFGRFAITATGVVEVPAGAKYFRLSCNSQLSYEIEYEVNIISSVEHIQQDAINSTRRYFDPCFTRGNITDTGGTEFGYRPVTALIKAPFVMQNVLGVDYKYRVFFYNEDGTYDRSTAWDWVKSGYTYTYHKSKCAYARFVFDSSTLPNSPTSPSPDLAYDTFKFTMLISGDEISDNQETIGYEKIEFERIADSYPDSNGDFQYYAKWDRSDYIPISDSAAIYIDNKNNTSDNAYYDKDKLFISRFTIATASPFIVIPPKDARYMVISNNSSKFFGDIYRKAVQSVEDFVQDNIDSVCDELDTIQNENSSSFFFITDLHLKAFNADYTKTFMPIERAMTALEKIDKRNAVDFMILGGDYLWNNQNTTKRLAIAPYAFLQQIMYRYRDKCFALKGNHDDNSIAFSAQGESGLILPDEEYRYIGKQYEKSGVAFNQADHNFYGYYDIPSHKIRIIFVNTVDIPYEISGGSLVYNGQHMTAIRQTQSEFIQNALKFEESGWAVLFMAHHGLVNSSLYENSEDYTTNLWEIIKAFKNKTVYSGTITNPVGSYQVSVDYTNNASNEVIAIISGHNHADRSAVVNDILNVSTGTACGEQATEVDGADVSPIYNSTTETLFDIFTVDREKGKLYATRYGLGNSREWTY